LIEADHRVQGEVPSEERERNEVLILMNVRNEIGQGSKIAIPRSLMSLLGFRGQDLRRVILIQRGDWLRVVRGGVIDQGLLPS
jgi:hypothetical protein